MIKAWGQWSERFMELSRRDRILLHAVSAFALLILSYLVSLEPNLKLRKQFTSEVAQATTDIEMVQAQMTAMASQLKDPNAALRAQLEALRTQQSAADEQFKQLERSLVPAQDMSQWLSELLQAQGRLRLVGFRTLPVVSVEELMAKKAIAEALPVESSAPAASATKTGKTGAAVTAKKETPPWLYRHGMEVTLQGTYADMVSYLSALEGLPRKVYWGDLTLAAEDHPTLTMTFQVYTLSLEKTWWLI